MQNSSSQQQIISASRELEWRHSRNTYAQQLIDGHKEKMTVRKSGVINTGNRQNVENIDIPR